MAYWVYSCMEAGVFFIRPSVASLLSAQLVRLPDKKDRLFIDKVDQVNG